MRFIYTRWFIVCFFSLVGVVILLFLQSQGLTEPVAKLVLYAPRPITRTITFLAEPVKQFIITTTKLGQLGRENALQATRISDLERQVVELAQLRRDNEVLRKELKFVQNSQLNLVSCVVLARDPEGLVDTIVLSCGANDGITSGMAVISDGRLAAKLIYVGQSTSTARLIIHDDSVVDSRLVSNASLGIVRGSFGSGLMVDQVSQNTKLVKGDLLVTAGVNALIPKNILIGEVGEIVSTNNDSFQKATVISPLEFNMLDFVFVVKP